MMFARARIAPRPQPATPPLSRAQLRRTIEPFTATFASKGLISLATDLAGYGLGLAAVLFAPWLAVKIAASVIIGLSLVNLGALAHEAAHGALMPTKRGNKIAAMICFTLVLFNYRLWIYDHHVLHHLRTNVKGDNSWSPLSPEEYAALPAHRRALYRLYRARSGLGILPYYLFSRWPAVHYAPGAWLPANRHASAWRYTVLSTAYALALVTALALAPLYTATGSTTALILGFAVPYAVWLTIFSVSVCMQHTHPLVPWFRTAKESDQPVEALSVHVTMPRWLNHVTHYAMEHPVHHVSADVPHYALRRAQQVLAAGSPAGIPTAPFTYAGMREVFARCKLYDYDRHVWLNFRGEVTGYTLSSAEYRAAEAARQSDALPRHDEADAALFFPAETPAQQPQDA